MLFQKWDVQFLARILMWTISVNIPRWQSRFLFLPLKPRVFQPETVALAHCHFTSARVSHVDYFAIKQNSLFPIYVMLKRLLRKLVVNNDIFWTASQQLQNSWQAKEGPRRLENIYWALLCWVFKALRKKKCSFYSHLHKVFTQSLVTSLDSHFSIINNLSSASLWTMQGLFIQSVVHVYQNNWSFSKYRCILHLNEVITLKIHQFFT